MMNSTMSPRPELDDIQAWATREAMTTATVPRQPPRCPFQNVMPSLLSQRRQSKYETVQETVVAMGAFNLKNGVGGEAEVQSG